MFVWVFRVESRVFPSSVKSRKTSKYLSHQRNTEGFTVKSRKIRDKICCYNDSSLVNSLTNDLIFPFIYFQLKVPKAAPRSTVRNCRVTTKTEARQLKLNSVQLSRSDSRNHEEFDGNKKMTEINMSEKTKRKKRKNFWCHLLCSVTTALLITDFQGKTKQTFKLRRFHCQKGNSFFKWIFPFSHFHIITAATFCHRFIRLQFLSPSISYSYSPLSLVFLIVDLPHFVIISSM